MKFTHRTLTNSSFRNFPPVDQISSMSFDPTGNFLATGDRGGRIVIFRRNDQTKHNVAYDVYGTFTSHEAGFDYLKSVEIEEKINKIEWLPKINSSRCLLTTNDKVIKLWRVKERPSDSQTSNNSSKTNSSLKHADSPFVLGTRIESSCRKTFANAHTFNINSLSVNSDQETFLSSDELRINIWNLQYTDQSFNIVDLKPPNMENLTEVITAAKFHPTHCSTFVYSLSKGVVRLCDMRQRALCDQFSQQFVDNDESANKSFFSEIISSISDISFSHSGQLLMARDYLNVKLWDMRQTAHPVDTFPVHDHFRAKLCGLYENDCIFDKFECSWSADDKHVLTGSYNNFFRVFDIDRGTSVTLQVSRDMIDGTVPLANKFVTTRSVGATGARGRENEVALESLDLGKKLLHLNWHPTENVLAIAATNNLFVLQNHNYISDGGSGGLGNSGGDVVMSLVDGGGGGGSGGGAQIDTQLNGYALAVPDEEDEDDDDDDQFNDSSPIRMEIDEV